MLLLLLSLSLLLLLLLLLLSSSLLLYYNIIIILYHHHHHHHHHHQLHHSFLDVRSSANIHSTMKRKAGMYRTISLLGSVFITHMLRALHKQYEVAFLILINTSEPLRLELWKWTTDKTSTIASAGTRSNFERYI